MSFRSILRHLLVASATILPLLQLFSVAPAETSSVYQATSYGPKQVNFPAVATAIEDHKSGCLFVATSPQNYAFSLDPEANPFNWSSVSVNRNDEVYVTNTVDKEPFSFQLANMNESQVEFMEQMYQRFSQNLVFPELSPNIQVASSITLQVQQQKRQRHMYLAHPISRPYTTGPSYPMAQQPQPKPQARPQSLSNVYQAKPSQPLVNLPTNYFNMNQSPYNASLLGDIYNFDLSGRILDIYSNSVSLHQGDRSIIYRNPSFFSYSRPNLPINISWFFVAGDFILFVYQDACVLAKPLGVMEPVELALVAEARKEIGELIHLWPYRREDQSDEQDS